MTTRKKKKSLSSNARPKIESLYSEYLLPKSNWIPDNQVTDCFNCTKSFIPLVRTKHHCRRCGNIFANRNFSKKNEFKFEKVVRIGF